MDVRDIVLRENETIRFSSKARFIRYEGYIVLTTERLICSLRFKKSSVETLYKGFDIDINEITAISNKNDIFIIQHKDKFYNLSIELYEDFLRYFGR